MKEKNEQKLHSALRRYQILAGVLALLLGGTCCIIGGYWLREHSLESDSEDHYRLPPQYAQIKQLMKPLQYSGVHSFLGEHTELSANFLQQSWTLHHLHSFQKNGSIELYQERYGLCGDLAAYIYEHILPLFAPSRYRIEFIRVAVSQYFPPPNGSHIVLKITDTSTGDIPEEFILDPSFHKYRRIEAFDDYLFYPIRPGSFFYDSKNTDETFQINIQSPILIKNNYIVGFSVCSVDGLFNPENFALILSLTKRYSYFSRPIFSIRKKNGIVGHLQNHRLAHKILTDEQYQALCKKITVFFNQLR